MMTWLEQQSQRLIEAMFKCDDQNLWPDLIQQALREAHDHGLRRASLNEDVTPVEPPPPAPVAPPPAPDLFSEPEPA